MTTEFIKGDRLRIKLTEGCTAEMVVTSVYYLKRDKVTVYRLTWKDYDEDVLDSWFADEMEWKLEAQDSMLEIFAHDMNQATGWGSDWSDIDPIAYAQVMRKQTNLFSKLGPMEGAVYDKPHRYELMVRVRKNDKGKETEEFTLTTSAPTRLRLQDVKPKLIQPNRTWFLMNTG